MAGRKSDFTLPTLDDLFSTQETLRMRSVHFLLSALQILPQCGIARRAKAGSRDIDVGGKNRL